jgi:xylitol oxidase
VTITNWAGNLAFTAPVLLRPRSVDEIRTMVASTPRLHALGAGHSFSPVADSPGALITLDDVPHEVEIDSERALVRVGAGVRYAELARALDARGLALANLASLPHISVAGTVATGTHGSGDRNGSLATAVAGIEMVTADGDLVGIGPDGISGAVVALGALGVVTSLTLKLVPSFTVRQWVYDDLPRKELDTYFDEIFASAYSVSVFTTWRNPAHLDTVWVKHRGDDGWTAPAQWHDACLADGQRHPVPGQPPGYATQQGGAEGSWHERLPHFRAEFTPSVGDELQTEYLVPRGQAVAALAALNDLAPRMTPLLMVCEIRTVAADDLWLSPCYGRETAAFHFTWRKDPAAVTALLPALEERLAPFGPRPHWGKVFTFSPAQVEASYPRLAEFRRLMSAYDPAGKFLNRFIRTFVGSEQA